MRAILKVMQFGNAIAGYRHQIEGSIAEAEAEMGVPLPDEHLWQGMLPIAGGESSFVHFDADDLLAFVQAKALDYVSRLILASDRFNGFVHGVAAYSRKREELTAMYSADMDGQIGTAEMSVDEYRRLLPYITVVNHLARQVREDSQALYDEVAKLIVEFGPIVKRYFDDPTFPAPSLTGGSGEGPPSETAGPPPAPGSLRHRGLGE